MSFRLCYSPNYSASPQGCAKRRFCTTLDFFDAKNAADRPLIYFPMYFAHPPQTPAKAAKAINIGVKVNGGEFGAFPGVSRRFIRGMLSYMNASKNTAPNHSNAAPGAAPSGEVKKAAAFRGSAGDSEASSGDTEASGANHKMLEQVLDGMLAALTEHQGDLTKVSGAEIVANSGMQASTFDYYYGDALSVMKNIYSEIRRITQVVRLVVEENELVGKPALYFLLQELSRQPKMLKILILTNDVHIWIGNLRWVAENYATGWKKTDRNRWEYLYELFCFQFSLVLKKWATVDFATEYTEVCMDILATWFTTDHPFTEVIEEIM